MLLKAFIQLNGQHGFTLKSEDFNSLTASFKKFMLFTHLWLFSLSVHTLIAHAHALTRCGHDNNPTHMTHIQYSAMGFSTKNR